MSCLEGFIPASTNAMYTRVSLVAVLVMASAVHGRGFPVTVRSPLTPLGSTPLFDSAPAGPATVGKSDKSQRFQVLFDTGM